MDTTRLRVALAAPALGSAVVVIPLFMLSDLGVPLNVGGPPVLVAVVVLTVIVLALRRPGVPRPVFPVAAIALVHLILAGRPMIRFGFHWLANANGDMGYYVLSATSLLTSGLRHPVDHAALASGHGYATVAHKLHESGVRVGSDVVLSSLAATTGQFAADVYMPLILSVSMVGICSAGALAMQFARHARAAVIAAALLAVSPLATYGVMQQLLPQVWGLALAAALCALLMRPEMHARARPNLGELVSVWILAVALFVVYVELAVSLSVSYALYVVFLAMRRRLSPLGVLRLWGPAIVGLVVIVNAYLPRAITFATGSARAGVASFGGLQLFGRSMVPTALPAIVGLQNLFAPLSARFMPVSIVAAMLLLAAVLTATVVAARKGIAACIVVVGDLIIGVGLAVERSDFGLFKLYMYVQPFLVAAVAVWITGIRSRIVLGAVATIAVLLVGVQLSTQASYVSRSEHPSDLRNASNADLLPAFRSILARAKSPVVSVTDNVPLTSLEGAAASVQRHPLEFLVGNPFGVPSTPSTFRRATAGDGAVTFGQSRRVLGLLARNRCELAMSSGSQHVLNRRQLPEGTPDLIPLECSKARDLLVFVVSSVGQTFFSKQRTLVSFWQLERDPAFPGRTMSGLGRYALLQAIHPTPGARLELDVSTSSLRDPALSFRLPPATVTGSRRLNLPVTGVGSARLFSPPLRPQMIAGQPYFLLDMGERGYFPPVPRTGLVGLWGRSIKLDPRLLTSYVRNISLVSARDYRAIAPPASIGSFPKDLGNENLEYSGIFEDGWVGRDSYVVLAPGRASQLVLQADVAPAAGQRLTVTIDGTRVLSKRVKPGPLDIRVPITRHTRKVRIRLHWSVANRLGPGDPRPAPARLRFVGFAPPPAVVAHLPHDLVKPGLAAAGVELDGWLQRRSSFALAGGRRANLVLRAAVPPPPAGQAQRVRVLLDGRTVASEAVEPGALEIRRLVPPSNDARRVVVMWRTANRLGPNDPRRASARLTYLGVVPARGIRNLSVPDGLRDPSVSYDGIYADGWAQKDVHLLAAGGRAGTLTLVARTPAAGQRVVAIVGGEIVGRAELRVGDSTTHIRLPPSPHARALTLRFAHTSRIGPTDVRIASVLLLRIGITPRATRTGP